MREGMKIGLTLFDDSSVCYHQDRLCTRSYFHSFSSPPPPFNIIILQSGEKKTLKQIKGFSRKIQRFVYPLGYSFLSIFILQSLSRPLSPPLFLSLCVIPEAAATFKIDFLFKSNRGG